GANSVLVAVLALPVATRIEAQGPFRLLGAAAAIVAVALACYPLVPGAAAAFLVGTVVYSFGEVIFSSAVPAAVARLAPAGRLGAVLEQPVHQLAAQGRVARRADEHQLVVVPELEYARRIRRQRDQRGDDQPFRASDRHGAKDAPRSCLKPEHLRKDR